MPSVTPLLVDVYELARDRQSIEGDLALADLKRLAASLLRTEGSLRYRIRGEIDGQGRPGAEMHLSATLRLLPLILHHASGLGAWIREIEQREGIRYKRSGSIICWWEEPAGCRTLFSNDRR